MLGYPSDLLQAVSQEPLPQRGTLSLVNRKINKLTPYFRHKHYLCLPRLFRYTGRLENHSEKDKLVSLVAKWTET